MEESNKPNISGLQAHSNPGLAVGSPIQFGDPMQYGVIKRIEDDPASSLEIAEIEMVSC